VQAALARIADHCHPATRIFLNFYSSLWEGPRSIAETLGLAKRLLPQNWLTVGDVTNLLYLSRFEVIRHSRELMCPVHVPLAGTLANRYLVRLWPFSYLASPTCWWLARGRGAARSRGQRERDCGGAK